MPDKATKLAEELFDFVVNRYKIPTIGNQRDLEVEELAKRIRESAQVERASLTSATAPEALKELQQGVQAAIEIIPGSMGGHVTLGLNILQKALRESLPKSESNSANYNAEATAQVVDSVLNARVPEKNFMREMQEYDFEPSLELDKDQIRKKKAHWVDSWEFYDVLRAFADATSDEDITNTHAALKKFILNATKPLTSATEGGRDAKEPLSKLDWELFLDMRDAAIAYLAYEKNRTFSVGEVRGMLADFAGHMIFEERERATAGVGAESQASNHEILEMLGFLQSCSACGESLNDDDMLRYRTLVEKLKALARAESPSTAAEDKNEN